MKARLRQIQCEEGEELEHPENWIPVRLERNAYWAQGREDSILVVLERTSAALRPPEKATGAPVELVP